MINDKLYYVCWYMTYYCNLACDYCYAFKKKDNYNFETFLSIGNELIKQGVTKINLTGGEPFASKNFIKVIEEFHSKLDLSVTTNGTIGTRKQLEFMKGKLERLTISIDSVDDKLGYFLRSTKCNTKNILDFVESAIKLDFEVKINTVVSKHNIHHLNDIGKWLSQFQNEISWKLFQVTDNPNILNSITDFLISDNEFEKIVQELSMMFPLINIKKASSYELNHNYVILTPEGNIQTPFLNSYKSIGNILKEDINALLRNSNYPFLENQMEFNKPTIKSI